MLNIGLLMAALQPRAIAWPEKAGLLEIAVHKKSPAGFASGGAIKKMSIHHRSYRKHLPQ
jgi:hypothetical protein